MNGASQRIKSNFVQEQSAMQRNGRIDLPKASKLILLENRISPMHRNGRIGLLQVSSMHRKAE